MNENEVSYKIRGAIFKTYNDLGPGLFESVYRKVLTHLLLKENIPVIAEVPLPVIYDNVNVELGFRLDLLVAGKVIVEIKSIETISLIHRKQLLTYLRLSQKKLGILVNFNTHDISKSIIRIVNNL